MITRRQWLCVWMLVALLAGCDDEFLTGASIARMRLLGAKVFVPSDAERAWLRPGDNGLVRFTVAHPDRANTDPTAWIPTRTVRSMIINCEQGNIGTGQPQCQEILDMFRIYDLYRRGELMSDAGVGDGGMPAAPISQEEIDGIFAALRAGIGCGDAAFELARMGIRQLNSSAQPAELVCPGDAPSGSALVHQFDLASDYPTTDSDRLVQGVICEYGEPIFKLEPPFFGCRYEVGSDANLPNRAPIAEVFFYTLRVERDGKTNAHPKFADAPFSIADFNEGNASPIFRAWNADPIPADCTGVTDPTIIRDFGDKSTIRITTEAMRELIGTMPDQREVYQIESFSTFGELDRQYSVIDDLDTQPVAELEWEHGKRPRDANDELIDSKRVDFYFLIRDGRGGFAVETRQFCLCAGGCPQAPN